jgi:predicted acylesterase/phospholipase RssA
MAKQENALQQLILMALNDDDIVVDQTCKTLSLLAKHTSDLANAILDTDSGSLKGLLKSDQPVKQQASLDLMAAISQSLGDAPNRLLTADIVELILNIINDGYNSSQDLRTAALKCLGNLAFSSAGKASLSSNPRVMNTILHLAEGTTPPKTVPIKTDNIDTDGTPHIRPKRTLQAVPLRIKAAAVRALAILGDISGVSRAVGRPLPQGRGLRILSLDGGGMKGMAAVRLLRQLELRTGRPIHSLFDLICGTSTGALLAVALGLRKFSMNEAEKLYKVLGQQVFSRPNLNKEKDESWMEAFYRTFHSKTQHVRAVVVGYKHDATVYETLLKEYCSFAHDPRCLSDALIDTACLDVPKIALVSTLASTSPAMPFVFRNYELPVALRDDREKICYHDGSSNHAVWQAVRASSAAIYYLDDFTCGGEKFQDGAVVANNPSVIALQEARALWPDAPIDVFVSIGTGSTPQLRRDRAISAFMDTGNILIESATNVERAHEALATMTPLIPSLEYFRFNPVDSRCSMELDEIDPLKWALLDEATDEFIEENSGEFDAVAAALLRNNSGGFGGEEAAVFASGLLGGGGDQGTSLSTQGGDGVFSSPLPKSVLGLHRGLAVFTSIPTGADPLDPEVTAKACTRLKYCSVSVDLQSYEKPRVTEKSDMKKQAEIVVSPAAAATSTPPKGKMPGSLGANENLPAPAVEPVAQQQQPSSNVVEVDLGSALGSVFSWFSPSKVPALEKEGEEERATTVAATTPTSPAVVANEPTEASTPQPLPAGDDRISPSPISHPIAFSPSPLPAKARASRTRPGGTITTEANGFASNSGTLGIASEFDNEVDSLSVLQHSIENALPPVGIVHVALRVCPSGFVLRWNDSFAAVTVPSPEADAIVRGAGYDPCSISLPNVFEHCRGEVTLLHGNNLTVRAVSTQYCGNVSVILVQYSSPAVILDANAIENKMRSALAGKIVVCSEVVPPSCLAAFSAVGALAVISPEDETTATGDLRSLSAFWARFYSELQSGTDVAIALRRAEEIEPLLTGAFKIR